ncbi:MAG TPA: CoA transferase [Dehalococcoidia bacterium]|nr:CoA transferase [Dehalococcoidia bacterium]
MLAGVRVVEITEEPGQYTGKLFADLGADVIKIEPTQGDATRGRGPFAHDLPGPDRSLRWWQFDSGKRSLALDLQSADGHFLLARLVAKADIVLCSGCPAQLEALGAPWPETGPIVTTITPYGWTGPKRDLPATDLIAQAAGGILYIAGFPGEQPTQVGGEIAYTHGSLHAAVATLMALWGRRAGVPAQHIDISLQESVAASVQPDINFWDLRGEVRAREPVSALRPGAGVYQATDGWVAIHTLPWYFDEAIAWLSDHGMAEELADPTWLDAAFRVEHSDQVNDFFTRLCGSLDKATIADEGQAHRVLVFPVFDALEIVNDDQVQSRGWLGAVDQPSAEETVQHPGPPFRLTKEPWRMRGGAPSLGQHTTEILDELGVPATEQLALAGAGVIA